MVKRIVVLPGDGIGPEVTAQAVKVLKVIGDKYHIEFEFDYGLIGAEAINKTGTALPDETIDKCTSAHAVLLGAVGDPKYDNDPSAKVRPEQGLLKIRKSLGLFANIRPIQTYPLLYQTSPLKEELLKNVDFVVYRELTGGIYFGNKGRKDDGNTAFDDCIYSREEITRIGKLAFEASLKRRKKLTLVDKANVLETSRLWREEIKRISVEYPEVSVDYIFVDAAAMKIVQSPASFDIVLTENMFGDILTDEASVLTGSIGMLPSASVGAKIALFEPIHGSYPQAAGKNIANPFGTILSAAMLLDYLDLPSPANAIRQAIDKSLVDGKVTSDINPHIFIGTEEAGNWICSFIS
jgi:3-isopropylmalate dehydrogenase